MIPVRPRTDGAGPQAGGDAHAPLGRARTAGPPPEVSVADAEAKEPGDGAAGLLDDLADGLLVVLGERLVQEAVLLEVAVQTTLDDLRDRLLGLALVLRGVRSEERRVGNEGR